MMYRLQHWSRIPPVAADKNDTTVKRIVCGIQVLKIIGARRRKYPNVALKAKKTVKNVIFGVSFCSHCNHSAVTTVTRAVTEIILQSLRSLSGHCDHFCSHRNHCCSYRNHFAVTAIILQSPQSFCSHRNHFCSHRNHFCSHRNHNFIRDEFMLPGEMKLRSSPSL